MASLPGSWEAGIGERSEGSYYSRPYYNPELGLDAEWYWDSESFGGDGRHYIVVRNSMGYPIVSRDYSTESKAKKNVDKVLRKGAEKAKSTNDTGGLI